MKIKMIAFCLAFASFGATMALTVAAPAMPTATAQANPLRPADDRKRVFDERRLRFSAARGE